MTGLRKILMAAGAACVVLGAAGCIRSRVDITSEPSGAEVIWRGQPYGATPVRIPFIWYWYYDIALEKPGYKRVEAVERFGTPPWFLMPVDLFLELVPFPITDTRKRHYVLEPRPQADLEEQPIIQEITPDLSRIQGIRDGAAGGATGGGLMAPAEQNPNR